MDKVKSYRKIGEIAKLLHQNGSTIVFTNGCFDLIHAGHVDYLKKASKLADVLIVGLNSDLSIKQIKGEKRPINTQKDRATILSAFYFVDYVVIFDEPTPLNLIQLIKPHVLVKGSDWQGKEIVGANFIESYGGRVVLIDYIDGKSTTSIIDKILKVYGCLR